MKKICFINCASSGSTGSLIDNLSQFASNTFDSCFILGESLRDSSKRCLLISHTKAKYIFHRIGTFFLGNDGFLGGCVKKNVRNFLKTEKPNLIHIHNIHRSFCNLEIVLNYAKENNVPIIWTLHDEWILTGRCCSFQQCSKWKEGCGHCSRKVLYPKSLFDCSSKFWHFKHNLINKFISYIHFVSPSKWLSDLVLNAYPNARISVIRNGVNQSVFKISNKNKDILSLANGRSIIGCVAYNLSVDKGYDDIVKLSNLIDKKKTVVFVLGANCKQAIEKINDGLYVVKQTSSKEEIASFYSTIDVMFDPTKGDNYPTTHIECLSCGTPFVTYDVGGAAESITSKSSGFAVKKGDIQSALDKIMLVLNSGYDRNLILKDSKIHCFEHCLEQYLDLYKNKTN